MKLEFFRDIFEKYLHTEFHGNASSGNRVVLCGQTDRRTDMKLIVVFAVLRKHKKIKKKSTLKERKKEGLNKTDAKLRRTEGFVEEFDKWCEEKR
jgi:hypothetical protein